MGLAVLSEINFVSLVFYSADLPNDQAPWLGDLLLGTLLNFLDNRQPFELDKNCFRKAWWDENCLRGAYCREGGMSFALYIVG